VQLLGRGGDVEAGLGHRGQVSQLVEFHGGILAKEFWGNPDTLTL
jgi:hypothetical protein